MFQTSMLFCDVTKIPTACHEDLFALLVPMHGVVEKPRTSYHHLVTRLRKTDLQQVVPTSLLTYLLVSSCYHFDNNKLVTTCYTNKPVLVLSEQFVASLLPCNKVITTCYRLVTTTWKKLSANTS